MTHSNKVAKLQEELKNFQTSHTISPLNFRYNTGHSNTTRSKSYKQTGGKLDLEAFNEIIKIDPHKRLALVEPRVTMEQLAKATLAYGLMPPVIPEFKGITVGGAIAGGAAESSSHKWGGFCDTCSALEVLCGDGTVLRTTPENHSDIFYGASGAYGSLGPILSAEIKLVPAKEFVRLHYHIFSNPLEALEMVQKLSHSTQPPDFIDAMAFAKNCSVVMG
ncbi:MAG TPA: FAD-binding protein, partial [Syntrophales bacterium]|nr:FAD-binding protein [Syntrophales bacterium]